MLERCLLGVLGVGPTLLLACGAPATDHAATGDENALTEGAWIQDNSPYYWAPSSFEEFQAAKASLTPATDAVLPALAADDPLTIRMQAWLDRVDAVVRPAMEQKLGAPLNAPKPIARILASRGRFNAWVSSVPTCIGAPLGAAAPGTASYVALTSVQNVSGVTCLRPSTWTTDGAVKFWDDGKPSCKLTLADGALAVGGNGCTVDPAATNGADVMVLSTGNYVQFSTDLLAAVDETAIAVTATHELGHYYLGHQTLRGAAKYGFWYTRTDDLEQTTPVPAANSAELEASYKEVIQAGRPLGGPSFSSHYSARLRPLLLSGLAPVLAERMEPNFVCAAARDALGPWVQQIVQGAAPPQDAQKSFVAFETELAQCAPRLALGGDPGASEISAGTTSLAAQKFLPGPAAMVTTPLPDDLGAFLDRLDVEAKALDVKAQQLVQQLKDNRVGLYTTEQAADEFAMHLATKMGFTTDEVLGGWIDLMRAIDRLYAHAYTPEQLAPWRQQSGELDADSCAALLASGFVKDGAPVSVNMGQLDEPHHASCYRLYNLWREGRAHHFEPGARLPQLAPEWSVLKAEAASITAQAQH